MRIRSVRPEFWSHPVMSRQEDATKLLAMGLLNLSDDEGFFDADVAMVRSALRPRDQDGSATFGALSALERMGYIEVREHTERGQIGRVVKFRSHQVISRPSPSKLAGYWDKSVKRELMNSGSATPMLLPDGPTHGVVPVAPAVVNERTSAVIVIPPAPVKPVAFASSATPAADGSFELFDPVEPEGDGASKVNVIKKAGPAVQSGGIVDIYNQVAARVGWQLCTKITEERQKGCKRLWAYFKDAGAPAARLAAIRVFFENAATVAFFTGENSRGWKASFKYLARSEETITDAIERAAMKQKPGGGKPGASHPSAGEPTAAEAERRRAQAEAEEGPPDWMREDGKK